MAGEPQAMFIEWQASHVYSMLDEQRHDYSIAGEPRTMIIA